MYLWFRIGYRWGRKGRRACIFVSMYVSFSNIDTHIYVYIYIYIYILHISLWFRIGHRWRRTRSRVFMNLSMYVPLNKFRYPHICMYLHVGLSHMYLWFRIGYRWGRKVRRVSMYVYIEMHIFCTYIYKSGLDTDRDRKGVEHPYMYIFTCICFGHIFINQDWI